MAEVYKVVNGTDAVNHVLLENFSQNPGKRRQSLKLKGTQMKLIKGNPVTYDEIRLDRVMAHQLYFCMVINIAMSLQKMGSNLGLVCLWKGRLKMEGKQMRSKDAKHKGILFQEVGKTEVK